MPALCFAFCGKKKHAHEARCLFDVRLLSFRLSSALQLHVALLHAGWAIAIALHWCRALARNSNAFILRMPLVTEAFLKNWVASVLTKEKWVGFLHPHGHAWVNLSIFTSFLCLSRKTLFRSAIWIAWLSLFERTIPIPVICLFFRFSSVRHALYNKTAF